MSNCNSTATSKKRRLDSELSRTSGVSELSNLTQTTILNDSDDSQNDYTDPNSSGPMLSPRSDSGQNDYTDPNSFGPMLSPSFDFTVPSTSQNTPKLVNRYALPVARTRRISFNLDGDDEQTQPLRPPPVPHHRYDNNKTQPQMIKRNRTRRATESSVPGMEAAEEGRLMHRSHTTSEFHLNQQQQQQQNFITSQLVAEHDAREREIGAARRPTLQRRSPSVNSLRGQENIYSSLQQSYVSIPNPNDYLHPVTHIEQPIPPNGLDRTCHIGDSASQSSSRYARVDNPEINSTRSSSEKNYRKGFYVLLVLNVIFILLNVGGLPFVYVTIQDHELHREEKLNAAYARQQDSPLCIKCNTTNKMKDFKTFGIRVSEDGNCCLPELDVFLDAINKKIESKDLADLKKNIVFETPMVQLKSKSIDKEKKRIRWHTRPEVSFHGQFILNDKDRLIKVPTEGYYYIYTMIRLAVNVTSCSTRDSCTLGHEVIRIHQGNSVTLESFKEEVSSNTKAVFNHLSHLEFVHYLKAGENISIRFFHEKVDYIDDYPSRFGMFLLSR